MDAFTCGKASGAKVNLSIAYLDEQTDKITSADGNMYDTNHDLHYVRPDQRTLFILDNIPINRNLLTNYRLVVNEADSQFGVGCQKKPVSLITPVISLQAALEQLGYRRTLTLMAEIFMRKITLPSHLSVVKPTQDNQLLIPNQMFAYICWDSTRTPSSWTVSTTSSTRNRNLPFNRILSSRNFPSENLITDTWPNPDNSSVSETRYGVILLEQPGVYMVNGRWVCQEFLSLDREPGTEIMLNNSADYVAQTKVFSLTGSAFNFIILVTPDHLRANSDGKARLHIRGTGNLLTSNITLNTSSQRSTWVQIALLC
jgi:hypothetical protein